MSRFVSSGNSLSVLSTPITAAPLTIAAAIYPTVTGVAESIASVAATASGNNRFDLVLSTTDQVRALARSTTGAAAVAAGTVTVNTWNFVGAVFVSDTERYAYRAGVQSAVNSTSITPASISAIYVGATGQPADPFTGRIAEVGIWNVALTPAEMAALAAGVLPRYIRPASLRGYWPLWGLDSPEPDLSSGKRNLALTGTPTYANHAPVVFRMRPNYVAEAAAVNPIYTQTKFRVYNDDGTGLGP